MNRPPPARCSSGSPASSTCSSRRRGPRSTSQPRRPSCPSPSTPTRLATWFRPILREVAEWDGVVLRLYVEDEGHSHELLRAGTVLGAITSNPVPVQGCSVERIGGMRYLPVATPELREQFALGRGVDWARMPVLEFNDHDDLQRGVLRGRGVEVDPPTHRIPSSEAFAEAVRAGLGWGALPTVQCADDLERGQAGPAQCSRARRRPAPLAVLASALPPRGTAHGSDPTPRPDALRPVVMGTTEGPDLVVGPFRRAGDHANVIRGSPSWLPRSWRPRCSRSSCP